VEATQTEAALTPRTHSNSTLIGVLQLAAAGFGFGFLGIFGKLAFRSGLTVGELLTLRFLSAAILLGGFLFVFARHRLRIETRQIFICAALGILGYAVFASLYFKAIEGVSVALASLLLYTYPVMVILGARLLFKERLTSTQWIAMPVAIGGLGLLLYGDTQVNSPLALIAGVGSAFCYALYILASSRLQAKIDPVTSGTYVIAFAALGLLLIHRPDPSRMLSLTSHQWLVVAGIAVVSTVGPLILFLSGLQKLGNAQASLLSTAEPLTAAAAGAMVFGESMSGLQLVGGALILGGMALTVLTRASPTE
jgi:drug/metabolite transporter (DMT)-like permease